MNLPTKITIARIAMIPLMLLFFCLQMIFEYSYIVVMAIFVIASCTDFVDGYLARKLNQVTDLGKFLDPIADKILVAAGLLILIGYSSGFKLYMDTYVMIIGSTIILSREFIIGVFRQIAATKNLVISADKLGKVKTVVTLIAISALLLAPLIDNNNSVVSKIGIVLTIVGMVAFIISVVLTLISGINYIAKNKHVLRENKKHGVMAQGDEFPPVTLCGDNDELETETDKAIIDKKDNVDKGEKNDK